MDEYPLGKIDDPVLLRVIAQFTRENSQRDIKLAQLSADFAAIETLRAEVRRLNEELNRDAGKIQELLTTDREARRLQLTPEQHKVIVRLEEIVGRRGELDLFNEDEMDVIRATLRTMQAQQAAYMQWQQRVTDLERKYETHENSVAGRFRQIHTMTTAVEDIHSWQEAHREEHDGLQKRLYAIDSVPRLTEPEVQEVRQMLRDWGTFFTQHVDAIKTMVQEWNVRSTSKETIRVTWKTAAINTGISLVVVVIFGTIIVKLLGKLLGL